MDLASTLGVVLEQLSNPPCILLDGLDEYQGDKWDMADFLLETATSQVKLCIASRPDAAASYPPSPLRFDSQLSSGSSLGLDPQSGLTDELSPLLEYAAMFMLHHATDVEQGLDQALYDILQPGMSNSFLCYHRFQWEFDKNLGMRENCMCFKDCPKPKHPLHLAIAHGLGGYVEAFLSMIYIIYSLGSREWDDVFHVDIDASRCNSPWQVPGSSRMSLLEYAFQHAGPYPYNGFSQTRIVALLLDRHPRADEAEISFALQYISAEIVKLLLRHWPHGKMVLKSSTLRSDRELEEEASCSNFSEYCLKSLNLGPMWYIARRKHTKSLQDNAGLIDLFLQRGKNINDQCGPFGTALHGALLHLSVTTSDPHCWKLLVAKGADVDARGPLGTPLEFVR